MVEWKKLGEVCEIKGRIGFRGYTREDQVDKGEGAISLSPGNINNGSMNYDSSTYITWEKYEESPEIIVNEGDIILCKTASVGKVARIRYLPEKATINPQLVLIKEIKTNPQYLYYVLDDNPFQAKIKGLAGVGSVPNVSQAKLASIQIPVPPLSEQERIVGILDTFTSSIENLKAQISLRRKQYEHYRDKLLDLEGKPGVEMKTLGEFGDVTKLAGFEFTEHVTYQESGTIIALRGLNVRDGHLDLAQVKYIDGSNFSKLERSRLIEDDMLFTYVGTIGNVALIDKNERYYLAPNVSRIRFNKAVINPKFALHYFMSDFFKRTQINKYLNSSSMKNLSMENIRKFELYLPSLSEQERIVSILDTFEASIANLEAQLKEREKQYEYYRNQLLTFE